MMLNFVHANRIWVELIGVGLIRGGRKSNFNTGVQKVRI